VRPVERRPLAPHRPAQEKRAYQGIRLIGTGRRRGSSSSGVSTDLAAKTSAWCSTWPYAVISRTRAEWPGRVPGLPPSGVPPTLLRVPHGRAVTAVRLRCGRYAFEKHQHCLTRLSEPYCIIRSKHRPQCARREVPIVRVLLGGREGTRVAGILPRLLRLCRTGG